MSSAPPEESFYEILTKQRQLQKKKNIDAEAESSWVLKHPLKYYDIHALITQFEESEDRYEGNLPYDLSYDDIQIIIDALACYQKTFVVPKN